MPTNNRLTYSCDSCGHEAEFTQEDLVYVLSHPSAQILMQHLGQAQEPTRTQGNIELTRSPDGKVVARRVVGQVEQK
jgi:hypothetical protein